MTQKMYEVLNFVINIVPLKPTIRKQECWKVFKKICSPCLLGVFHVAGSIVIVDLLAKESNLIGCSV